MECPDEKISSKTARIVSMHSSIHGFGPFSVLFLSYTFPHTWKVLVTGTFRFKLFVSATFFYVEISLHSQTVLITDLILWFVIVPDLKKLPPEEWEYHKSIMYSFTSYNTVSWVKTSRHVDLRTLGWYYEVLSLCAS